MTYYDSAAEYDLSLPAASRLVWEHGIDADTDHEWHAWCAERTFPVPAQDVLDWLGY